ncbi:MAG: DUF3370 family protein [Prochlorococcaceae cyanobacterium]|jgi:hypothetical protein
MRHLLPVLLGLATAQVLCPAVQAQVALMAGRAAQPLQGRFNNVPVLHSNQPEEVWGPGILVSTTPGSALAETGETLANATYTFNGEFGLHAHHKYAPSDARRLGVPGGRRGQLTLAVIAINPGDREVTLRFEQGAVKNSFEAPYLSTNLMGVIPQGRRPWNTGPGAATAVQMLRGSLDRNMPETVRIPARSRVVVVSTDLPARGIANALLKGRSDGPFQMAVVAAEDPSGPDDMLRVLDGGRLAPGRTYLARLDEIRDRRVFARVAGVAIGDAYQASLRHDLKAGALHVPLTTTTRHNFGTNEVQVNELATRMVDSSLDNVGTYGVRFDVDLQLRGEGTYDLVFSHPTLTGRQFTAYRGTIGVTTPRGYEELHVGLRSGQSLSLSTLNLQPGVVTPVRVSLVYPADATPGHLLSVVPAQQLLALRQQEQLQAEAREAMARQAPPPISAPPQPSAPAGVAQGFTDTPAPTPVRPRPTSSRPVQRPVLNKTVPTSRPTARPPQAPPPVLPSSGWPPTAPAMIDPSRPYQLMRNWFGR